VAVGITRETIHPEKRNTMKTTQDAIGRTIQIIGVITPTTLEQDAAEMRRIWTAQGLRKDPPYQRGDVLLARGGCKRRK
jgi:hypothetical protein